MKILLIDDDKIFHDALKRLLGKENFEVVSAFNGLDGLAIVDAESIDLVLLDLEMPGLSGLETLMRLKEKDPDLVIVIVTGYPSIKSAVSAIKLGAYDYLSKPCTPDDIRIVLSRAIEKQSLLAENIALRQRLLAAREETLLVGQSRVMKDIKEMAKKVAISDSTVLITGESGTGKELIARTIFEYSPRRSNQFMAVDCSTLVETLLESELFGHVKGAFTGAIQNKKGLFELARGGTFFFDEVGNLPLNIQAKLLRVLQEKEIKRVGGVSSLKVDVRIIAATNKDLKEAIKERTFREDLFYRLNVVPINLPPLREHKEDIPLLAYHFLYKYSKRMGKKIDDFSPGVIEQLLSYHWPGNVRELENVIERAAVLEDKNTIQCSSLPWHIPSASSAAGFSAQPLTLEEVEKNHIANVLQLTGFHRSLASKFLGIDRKTLYQKILKYHLKV